MKITFHNTLIFAIVLLATSCTAPTEPHELNGIWRVYRIDRGEEKHTHTYLISNDSIYHFSIWGKNDQAGTWMNCVDDSLTVYDECFKDRAGFTFDKSKDQLIFSDQVLFKRIAASEVILKDYSQFRGKGITLKTIPNPSTSPIHRATELIIYQPKDSLDLMRFIALNEKSGQDSTINFSAFQIDEGFTIWNDWNEISPQYIKHHCENSNDSIPVCLFRDTSLSDSAFQQVIGVLQQFPVQLYEGGISPEGPSKIFHRKL